VPRARTAAIAAALTLGCASVAGCGGSAALPAPARPTGAIATALAWFSAANAHDAARAARYFAPAARASTAWVGTTHVHGPIFTDVMCVPEPGTQPGYAELSCTYHEPVALSHGQPYMTMALRRVDGMWQILSTSPG
jgi:hypothetical protein